MAKKRKEATYAFKCFSCATIFTDVGEFCQHTLSHDPTYRVVQKKQLASPKRKKPKARRVAKAPPMPYDEDEGPHTCGHCGFEMMGDKQLLVNHIYEKHAFRTSEKQAMTSKS